MPTSFDRESYRIALRHGALDPCRAMTPFINVSRRRYRAMAANSKGLKMGPVRERLDGQAFLMLLEAVALSLRASHSYFPAYRFLANELLSHDWLAMVDWNYYNRDHVVHQPMSVYAGLSLLEGRDLGRPPHNPGPPILFPGGHTLMDLVVDHIMQSPRCIYLFEYLRELGAPEVFWRPGPVARRLWPLMFKSAFFLAALFHDIGYPWQFMLKLSQQLEPHHPSELPLGRDADWLLERYGKRLLFYPFFGWRSLAPDEPPHWLSEVKALLNHTVKKTHGMPGAIALLHLNDQLREHPVDERARPPRRFCLEWAAMAVLMHDMVDSYEHPNGDPPPPPRRANGEAANGNGRNGSKPGHRHLRLKLSRDPLSYVMTLVDALQDFNRIDAVFHPVPTGTTGRAGISYRSRCNRVSVDIDHGNREMVITYHYAGKSDFLMNRREFLPRLAERYFDPQNGYLDISELGLSRVRLEAA